MLHAVQNALENIIFGNGFMALGGLLVVIAFTLVVRLSKGLDI